MSFTPVFKVSASLNISTENITQRKMVNLIAVQKTLIKGLMKLAGIVQHTVEIEPGTTLNIWVPAETIKKPRKSTVTSKKCNESEDGDGMETCNKPNKPVMVFLQGFFADGIYTWQFQVGSFTKNYSVYVPDLLFFGESVTDKADRSPKFQADCLVKGLMKLGIERCTVVGFSYGGIVAFKMGEFYPELVEALVITGSTWSMTDSICSSMLEDSGSTFSEILNPNSVSGTRALLKLGVHMKLSWFPDRFHEDFLEVMFNNRKERAELCEGFRVRNEDAYIPNFQQRIHLLWGEYDQVSKLELAENMKEQLGSNTTLEKIKKAGHLVQVERPCQYTRCLKRFLASLHTDTHNARK